MCTPEQMECVKLANDSMEKPKCLKRCSGLLVASFEANQKYQSKKFISKLSTDYWNYKGYFTFPKNFKR